METSGSASVATHAGLVKRLFLGCHKVLQCLLHEFKIDDTLSKLQHARLEHSYHALCLWAADSAVCEDKLDLFPQISSEIRDMILAVLGSIGNLLVNEFLDHVQKRNLINQVLDETEIWTLLKQAEFSLGGRAETLPLIINRDNEDIDDDIDEELEDLSTYIQCLTDLGPSIQMSFQELNLAEKAREASAVENNPQFQYYLDYLRRLFPKAVADITEQLGRSCLERSKSIRENIVKNERQDEILDVNRWVGNESILDLNREPTLLQIMAGRGKPPIYALLEGSIREGSFICVGCGRKIQARTILEYYNHVLQDIKPYTCFYRNCSVGNDAFPNLENWINHLHLEHKLAPGWQPCQCPLCHRSMGNGRNTIMVHLGEHMEYIATIATSSEREGKEAKGSQEGKKAKGSQRDKTEIVVLLGSNPSRYFLPGEGIAREVITADICRYLGPDALVKPYHHDGVDGFFITAYRMLTPPMIEGLKMDSKRWLAEVQQSEHEQRDSVLSAYQQHQFTQSRTQSLQSSYQERFVPPYDVYTSAGGYAAQSRSPQPSPELNRGENFGLGPEGPPQSHFRSSEAK